MRRAVWERDQGKGQWPVESGGICGCTRRLDYDHVVPEVLGGESTVENGRLLCRFHNLLAARRVLGNELMDRYARNPREAAPREEHRARRRRSRGG